MSSGGPGGRLTLSWVGKDQALLGTESGGYEWVPRDDARVGEVRLLHHRGAVGHEAGPDAGHEAEHQAGSGNRLIVGDARDAMRALLRLPEQSADVRGRVKLVYLDPPFNTGQAFAQYDDALEHSVWLTMMRDRLLLVRELLARDGSVWVHLDDSELAYCRILMDEIFGRSNFIATIVWEKDQGRRNDAVISHVHDYILVYAADRLMWREVRNMLPRGEEQDRRYKNPDHDPRGPWLQGADSTARSGSEALRYPVTLPSGRVVYPPSGVFWRYSLANFEAARAEGRVYFGADGDRMPIVKRYLSEVQSGLVPRTLWTAAEVGSNMSAKRDHLRRLFPEVSAFATPKPELLLHRIIHIATDPGDLVLDCFAGSGTTAAVAHKMGRRWITIEKEPATVETYTRPRLDKVVAGDDPGGVTGLVGWAGGGGFNVLEVGPSMYDLTHGPRPLLAEWATNGAFAEGVAAQLGYQLEHDAPFVGRQGRARLAVVDGVVDDDVVRAILSRLDDGERAVVVGKGATTTAEELLRATSPGSRLRKAPRDLIARGVLR